MGTIVVTGSVDGLGFLAATALLDQGHQVVFHARNAERAEALRRKAPGARHIVLGDLARLDETQALADQVNALGPCAAVIHNAGVYSAPAQTLFAVNTLAPYVLTCLIPKPQRLIYLSSGMRRQGRADLNAQNLDGVSYSDTKLYVLMLSLAVARRWPEVSANAVDPGWVPTKMGGCHATDDLHEGYATQVWLAGSAEPAAQISGRYLFHRAASSMHPQADDPTLQARLLDLCQTLTGVMLPA